MREITELGLSYLKESHTIVVSAEAMVNEMVVATTYGTPRIQLLEGSVTVDRRSQMQRSFSATVVDPDGTLVPALDQTTVDPLVRASIRLSRGIRYLEPEAQEYTYEMWPLGTFIIEEATPEESQGEFVEIQLSGRDRSILISENKWDEPFSLTNGNSYDEAIAEIINNRAWNFTPHLNFEASANNIPDYVTYADDERTDPWEEAAKLAESDGMELFVDAADVFVLRTIPDPKILSPVWAFNEQPGSTLLTPVRRSIQASEVYNGVIVRGTASWLLYEVVGVAWDDDPTSPTYVEGPLGKRPLTIDDALVMSAAQAATAAAKKLPDVLGVSEEVRFNTVVNPALEAGDVVSIESSALKLSCTAMIDSLTIPLSVEEPMQGVIRRQRNAGG